MRKFFLTLLLLVILLLPTFSLQAQKNILEHLSKAEIHANADSAILLYNDAFKLAKKEGKIQLADSILFLTSRRFISVGKLDTARTIAKEGLKSFSNPDDSPMASGFYNLIAATYHHQNTLDSASIYYLKAIKLLEIKNDTLKAAKLRFNLANIFLSYKDYEQASQEFQNTISVMKRYKDSSMLSGSLSALSTCKLQMGEIDEAKNITQEGLKISIIRNDLLGQMLSYRQIGQIAENENILNTAISNYRTSYDIAQSIKLPYYISMLEMNLCEIYTQMGDASNSLFFCKKSLEATQSNQFSSHLKSLFTNLSKSYQLNGDFENALLYVNKANEIREKELNEENKEIVNELVIKYETEQKDKQILEQKLMIASEERQNFIYASIAAIAIVVIGILVLLSYYRNKLNKAKLIQINQERERDILKAILNGEESERNRLAVDLHDGISNLLFSCKLSLSSLNPHDPYINAKVSENIKLIDNIREESRRMSHNLMPPNFTSDTMEAIFNEYIIRMNEATTKKTLHFQTFGIKTKKIDNNIKLILFRSIQELIGNAHRHSEASEIDLQLFYHPNNLTITLEDNGKGFHQEALTNGKGITSLQTRLSSINATLEIDSVINKGTSITINLPQ